MTKAMIWDDIIETCVNHEYEKFLKSDFVNYHCVVSGTDYIEMDLYKYLVEPKP